MLRRTSVLFAIIALLSACSMNETKPQQPQPMNQEPPAPVAKQMSPDDIMRAMDRPSVEVYPLTGPAPASAFSNKNLQPLSQKVIAEGYPVMDPSVTVYPLKMPSSIPNVALDNVRNDATSTLYAGKVKSNAMQMKPIMDNGALYPADDMGGGVVASEPLPPVIGQNTNPDSIDNDVPMAKMPPMPPVPFFEDNAPPPAAPSVPAYTPNAPGRVSAPIDTSYGGSGQPTVSVPSQAPISSMPAAAPSVPSSTGSIPSLTGF